MESKRPENNTGSTGSHLAAAAGGGILTAGLLGIWNFFASSDKIKREQLKPGTRYEFAVAITPDSNMNADRYEGIFKEYRNNKYAFSDVRQKHGSISAHFGDMEFERLLFITELPPDPPQRSPNSNHEAFSISTPRLQPNAPPRTPPPPYYNPQENAPPPPHFNFMPPPRQQVFATPFGHTNNQRSAAINQRSAPYVSANGVGGSNQSRQTAKRRRLRMKRRWRGPRKQRRRVRT